MLRVGLRGRGHGQQVVPLRQGIHRQAQLLQAALRTQRLAEEQAAAHVIHIHLHGLRLLQRE
ncbi:MAG: hypothetical protein NZM65_08830, partial [Flavobacteriales bacterium]|nr:hypothetical protein [Flavobacteriales bacterium]MDW8410776.1 hypothetical protein [Flavobacteriales bacterium]